jgi:hypothetical protein
MSDTDEIRAALSDALQLPGEVYVRPGAASAVRARASARRRSAVVTFVVAGIACLGIAAVLARTIGPSDLKALPPATGVTVTPSPSAPATVIGITPGPRNLMSPIAIRPVLREYQICPLDVQTLPAAVGPHCYRLGPAALVIYRLRDLSAGLSQVATGTLGDGYTVNLTMTAHDAAAFSALTAASLNKQIAVVVTGKVWAAPTIQGRITDGAIQIQVPAFREAAQALVTELTG